MLRTAFTDLVGCTAPIQMAPMGAAGSPELAVAVMEAGGMGMFATALVPIPAVERMVAAVAARTDGSLGVNVLMPFYDEAFVEALAPQVRVVDFYHGAPRPEAVARVHQAVRWRGGRWARWTRPRRRSTPGATCSSCAAPRAAGACGATGPFGRCSTRCLTPSTCR